LSEQPEDKVAELPARRRKHGEAYYVVGGPVQPRRGCYIERTADQQLLDKLREGEYCNVIAPRQTGKSSLVAKTAMRLRQEGFGTAVVDLSQSVSRNADSEAGRWYYGIAYRIVRDLRLTVDLQHWWQEKKPLSPLQRLNEFFWEIVLANTRSPVVIFLDSLDVAESLEFAVDLFMAVRGCYDARAAEPDYERLRFVLLGTILPVDGKASPRHTLYDIGRRIELQDFTFQQARPLCRELGLESGDAERALYRVFYWTGGQPYLTQKLCRAVARSTANVDCDEAVDRLVESRFLAGNAPFSEPNLRVTRELLGRRDKLAQASLRLYRRVSRGRTILYDPHEPQHQFLRVAGLIRVSDERRMRVRNLIYGRVFTARWVSQTVPFDWRSATTAVAFVLLIVGIPYWYTRLLPQPYIETLRVATVDYDVAVDAYRGLSRIPGFGARADSLYAGVLERRSRQADTWERVLAADMELRAMPGHAPTADALLAEFWDRRASSAEAREMRDLALVYRLRALEQPNLMRQQRAASLMLPDYPDMLTTIRPGAPIDALGIDPTGVTVVTLSNGHLINTWNAETGLRQGEVGGFEALAEEFVTVRRRIAVETPGAVRGVSVRAWVDHPQPTDLVLRVISPAGRVAVMPILRSGRDPTEPYEFLAADHPELAAMRGEEAQGTWILEIEDQLSGTTGALQKWSLKLSTRDGHELDDLPAGLVPVPDPRPTSQVLVRLSPDARRAAAVSASPETRGYLQVWDVNAGTVTARIPVEAEARFMAFGAEGQFLVTAATGVNGRIGVWRVAAGQEVLDLEPKLAFSSAPALSVTGSFMAVADGNTESGHRVRSWDLASGEERRALTVGAEVAELALGPEGRWLALLDRENVVRVFDLPARSGIGVISHDSKVQRMAFDPSGRWLVTVDSSSTARVWDLRPGQVAPVPLLVRETGDATALAFGADGDFLMLHGRGRSFEWLRLPDGRAMAGPLRHAGDWNAGESPSRAGQLQSAVFRADGLRAVTGRGGRTAITWQIGPVEGLGGTPDADRLGTVTPVPTPPAEDQAAASAPVAPALETPPVAAAVTAVNPVADQIATGDAEGRVVFRDRGQPWSVTPPADAVAGHAAAVAALSFSADGSHLVSVGQDGNVLLWSAERRELIGTPFHHGSGDVSAVAVSNDGLVILIVGELGAQVWSAQTGEPRSVLGPGRRIRAAALTPDGRLAATASGPGELRLWNADTGAEVWSATAPGRVTGIALRDGQGEIAAATENGDILLWKLPDRTPPVRLPLNGYVLGLRYTPGGDRLVVQTSEWVHLVDLAESPRIVASRLMPGLTAPGGMRFETDDGSELSMLIDRAPAVAELLRLDIVNPATETVHDIEPGEIDDWLHRLKLRFDTTGELVPWTGERGPGMHSPVGVVVPAMAPPPVALSGSGSADDQGIDQGG
jgi:WD40 repeat protein